LVKLPYRNLDNVITTIPTNVRNANDVRENYNELSRGVFKLIGL